MGRSVSYPSNAKVITFATFESEDDDCHWEWQEHLTNVVERLIDMFPSVTAADRWIDREDHVLAENGLAEFGISEYCGLVSYWIVPKELSILPHKMRNRWIDSIADKFVAAFGELSKIGSMSNGEGVYRRIDH